MVLMFVSIWMRRRRRRRAADCGVLQGISTGVDWELVQEFNADAMHSRAVLDASQAQGPLPLIKDLRPMLAWQSFVHDDARRSYAYILRAADGEHPVFSPEQLDGWFEALHPRQFGTGSAAWSQSFYRGEELLRSTAWAVLDPACRCEYGYSDTWQRRVVDGRMLRVLSEISTAVASACGLETCLGSLASSHAPASGTRAPQARGGATGHAVLNSVNLNYYPRGGGVGWHADDEFLFDRCSSYDGICISYA